MDIIPHITAAHANILTNGPPNIIIAPRPIKAAPDQLDISFILDIIQFILEPPFFYLILALTFLCLFHARKPPSLNDQYAK